MSDKEKLDKVREEIAIIIHNDWSVAKTEWSKHLLGEKKIWLDTAYKILSHPDICIKSDDQSLPTNPYRMGRNTIEQAREDTYNTAQTNMLKDGWIKPVKEIENER